MSMAVSGTTSSTGTVLSVDDMLANAKKAAASNAKPKSAVEKLLADHPTDDSPKLSAVAKLTATAAKAKPKESYTEQEWYIKAKVAQLKTQIQIYSNLPGLDPSGGIMESLTKEVNELVSKQKAKLKVSQDELDAKQAEYDKLHANDYKGVSSDDILSKAKGTYVAPVSDEVKKLLASAKKGATVDTLA